MKEKNHVGRPTNEEVSIRKRKNIKVFLISLVCALLLGGLFIF